MKPPVEPPSPAAGFVYRVSFDWRYLQILMCLFGNEVFKPARRHFLAFKGCCWEINRHIYSQMAPEACAQTPSHVGVPHLWLRSELEHDVIGFHLPGALKVLYYSYCLQGGAPALAVCPWYPQAHLLAVVCPARMRPVLNLHILWLIYMLRFEHHIICLQPCGNSVLDMYCL